MSVQNAPDGRLAAQDRALGGAFVHGSGFDAFDLRILESLQTDARLTNTELAERVGLSASQCSRRRAALEAAGVIAGYQAMLSHEALGLEILAFVHVRFASHSHQNDDLLLAAVENTPGVIEAYSLTGPWDYLLKIAVPRLADIEAIINRAFLSKPHIAQIQTTFILKRLKQTGRLPLPPQSDAPTA